MSATSTEQGVSLLRCPFCRGALDEQEGGDALACGGCGRRYPVEDGIPHMLHPDLPGAREKLAEIAGWPEKAKAEGWYEPDDAVDTVLPFPAREIPGWEDISWLATGHSFQVLLDRYVIGQRGLRVLEVGAAKCWAAPYWHERECEYIATDILVDPKIGLGRGRFYGDFLRVQADAENLPFPDDAFDLVYGCAALHHALDLRRMVAEMARVTRPGGVVAGLNEGIRGVLRDPANPDQAREKELGINEHVHTVWAYAGAFQRAGLRVRRIERAEGWPPVPWGGLLSRIPKVGLTAGTVVHLSAATYASASLYARKPA